MNSKIDFNDLDQNYRYKERVESRLILSLPKTDFRPEAMRVTERMVNTPGSWFEVETFDERTGRWIEQKTHSDKTDAVRDALGWYPSPGGTEKDSGWKYDVSPDGHRALVVDAEGFTVFEMRTPNPNAEALAKAVCAPRTDHAELAREFNNELLDSFERLSGIAEKYGTQTLADIMYLSAALLEGSHINIEPNDESRLLEVLAQLPSQDKWLENVHIGRPCPAI